MQLAYVTGRYLWNRRTVTDLYSSIGYFEQALEIENTCAVAHAGVADANVVLGIWGLHPPDVAFGAARQAAARALALDPNLAEAHTSFAEVLKGYEWDWCQAERRYQHALSLRPGYAPAHQCYAQLLVSLRRYGEAASHIEQARRADPVSPAINSFLPYIYLAGREYGRALQEAQRAVELEPSAPLAHWYLGRAHLFSNHVERAVGALEHAVTLAGPASMWEAELSYARARAGDHPGALRLLSELIERARRDYVSPYDLASRVHGHRGPRVRARSPRAGFRPTRDADQSGSAIPSSTACGLNHDSSTYLNASASQVLRCKGVAYGFARRAEQSVPSIFNVSTCTALIPSAVAAVLAGSFAAAGGISVPVISMRCPTCFANSCSRPRSA